MNISFLNNLNKRGQSPAQPSTLPVIGPPAARRANNQGDFIFLPIFSAHAATIRNQSGIAVDGWIVASFLGRVAGLSRVYSAHAF